MFYLIISLTLIIVILIMPIKILIKTFKKNNDDLILIKIISGFGLIRLKYEIPYINLILNNEKVNILYKNKSNKKNNTDNNTKDKKFGIKELKEIHSDYKVSKEGINRAFGYLLRKIKIRKFYIKIVYGFSDVMTTSLMYGLLWSVIGSLTTVTNKLLNITIKDIVIIPDFEKSSKKYEFSCIITLKLGHIIITGIKAIPSMIKIKKNKTLRNKSIKKERDVFNSANS